MDLFDRAQELEMLQRDSSIAEALKRPTGGPTFAGKCYYCFVSLPSPFRFCDGECRGGWEHDEAARKRNGKVEESSSDDL